MATGKRSKLEPVDPDTGKPRCVRIKKDGERCQRRPIKGATLCRSHGGTAPQIQQAAQRKVDQQNAEAAVVRFGLTREIGPHEALLEDVKRSAHLVTEYEGVLAQISAAKRDSLVQGVQKAITLPDGTRRVEAGAAYNQWLRLYNDERRHLVAVSAAAINCGVAEHLVHLAERQAQMLAGVVMAVLADFNIDMSVAENRERVRLRMIEAGESIEASEAA